MPRPISHSEKLHTLRRIESLGKLGIESPQMGVRRDTRAIPTVARLRQEVCHKSEANLGYTVRLCLNKKYAQYRGP